MPNENNTTPLPAATAEYIAQMREELTSARLGHLGRRFGMLLEQAQESASTYGSRVLVSKFGNDRIEAPVETTIEVTMRVKAGSASRSYTASVGSAPTAGVRRPETPLAEFEATVPASAT